MDSRPDFFNAPRYQNPCIFGGEPCLFLQPSRVIRMLAPFKAADVVMSQVRSPVLPFEGQPEPDRIGWKF